MNDCFWRLPHEDLAAVLGRPDLSWETARVYLALADLTIGYGKEKDRVSLGQIAEIAGIERSHVVRALKRLTELGLYQQEQVSSQKVIRWVVWPPSPVAEAGTVACTGNTTATEVGNRTVAKGVAGAGTHQDSKKERKGTRRLPMATESDGFDRFWSAYSRKVAKADAAKAWHKIHPDQGLVEKILAALDVQRKSADWVKDGGHYIPYPATWLNGKRWEDEVSATQQANPSLDDPSAWGCAEEEAKELLQGVIHD